MLLAALVVSVSGCANTNHPQAIRESSDIEALRSEIDENAVPKETLTDSFSESKTSSDDSVIDVKGGNGIVTGRNAAAYRRTKPCAGDTIAADSRFKRYAETRIVESR